MLQSCYRETAVLSAEEDSPANLDELVKRRHYHGDGLPGTTRLQIKDEPGMRLLSRSSFASEWESGIYNQITRRLLPYLILLYIVSFLDRVNVGFAKLQMAADIGLSDVAYATGAGIFFLGYCLFGLPSSLLLQRLGTKYWITRLLIVWGVLSTCTMFVRSEYALYAMRFGLGVVEAGFYPGVVLYLGYWYPNRLRSQVWAIFSLGVPLAGVFGGPLSGGIMRSLDGAYGLRGWQWLFLLEGLPAIVLGLINSRFMDDGPAEAKWLSSEAKQAVQAQAPARAARQERSWIWFPRCRRPQRLQYVADVVDRFHASREHLRPVVLAAANHQEPGRERSLPQRLDHQHSVRICRRGNDRHCAAFGPSQRAPLAARQPLRRGRGGGPGDERRLCGECGAVSCGVVGGDGGRAGRAVGDVVGAGHDPFRHGARGDDRHHVHGRQRRRLCQPGADRLDHASPTRHMEYGLYALALIALSGAATMLLRAKAAWSARRVAPRDAAIFSRSK